MNDNHPEKKKQSFSLSVKLNLLITAIVLIVSAVLVFISYHSFTKTAYIPYEEELREAEERLAYDENYQWSTIP
ncbi:MAG: hypothetical protein IJM90_08680 [Firmicutes bacterium]|nr:hypothetical protein [Bacillota bacterium]